MREKVQRFMLGRYGFDELSKVYVGITMVLMVLSIFTGNFLFYLISLILLVYKIGRAHV